MDPGLVSPGLGVVLDPGLVSPGLGVGMVPGRGLVCPGLRGGMTFSMELLADTSGCSVVSELAVAFGSVDAIRGTLSSGM